MLFFILSIVVSIGDAAGIRATESDHGRMTLMNDGVDPNIYFSDDLDMVNKIHYVISEPDCECVGAADVTKVNLIDYMIARNDVFSYALYVNDGHYFNRKKCPISALHIQERTDIKINTIGPFSYPPEHHVIKCVVNNTWDCLFLYNTEPRVEGVVLWKSIRDFHSHAYVKENMGHIFDTDKSGGILMTQGNVMMRPCRLFPWYLPWIYDEYDSERSLNYTREMVNDMAFDVFYHSAETLLEFNALVLSLKQEGIITQHHISNLIDNTGSESVFSVFHFQAIFIPHRYSWDFQKLIDRFAHTDISPFIYVPYIMQLMFDKNDWKHFKGSDYNETLHVGDPLLLSCRGSTYDDVQKNVDQRGASDLYWFASGWCGVGVFQDIEHYIEVKYQYIVVAEEITGMRLYQIFFSVMFLGVVCAACCCAMRRGVRMDMRRRFRFINRCLYTEVDRYPDVDAENEFSDRVNHALKKFELGEENDDASSNHGAVDL